MKRLRALALALVLAVVLPNAVFYAHAWRFTHFAGSGRRTPNPEDMSVAERVGVLLTGVKVPRPRLRARPDAALRAEEVRVGPIATWVIPRADADRPAGALGAHPDDTVLLFHGYGGTRSDLVDEAAFFRDRGLRAVLVDFPGSGGSDGDVTTLGWGEAEVVRDLVAHFAPGEGGRVVLYGRSMGSAAILRAVGVLGVKADRLVLENPFDRLVTTAGHRFEQIGLPAFPFAHLLVFWGGVQHGFDGLAHDPVAYARGVTVPTRLMVGDQDERSRPEEVEAVGAALAGGRYPTTVFPGVGHRSLFAADRDRWGKAVDEVLSALHAELPPDVPDPEPDCVDPALLLARRAAFPVAALARRWEEVADPPMPDGTPIQSRVLASVATVAGEVALLVECRVANPDAGGRDVDSRQHLLGVGAGGLRWSEEVGAQACCGVEWWEGPRLRWEPAFPPGVGSVRLSGVIDGRGDQEGYGGRASRWVAAAPSTAAGIECEWDGLPRGAFALERGRRHGGDAARVRTRVAREADALVLTESFVAKDGRRAQIRRDVRWDGGGARFVEACAPRPSFRAPR